MSGRAHQPDSPEPSPSSLLFLMACISSYSCPTWSSVPVSWGPRHFTRVTGELTAQLLKLGLVNLLPHPGFALDLLRVQLPLGKEPNLATRSAHPLPPSTPAMHGSRASGKERRILTRCAGFSTFRCARNSDLIYSSPRSLISAGKNLRCARSRRRYSGIGGSKGMGACAPRRVVPAPEAAEARREDDERMIGPVMNPGF